MRTLRTLLVAAGLLVAAAAPAAAAPPSTDHTTNATAAAAWLAHQVTADGFVESAFVPGTPDLSVSAQAVPAFVAAGVAGDQVHAILGYLGGHVDDLVFDGTADKPGSLAYLILAVVAGGGDATSFGTPATNLVDRLLATMHTTGADTGLFGTQSPAFDGAYRQGLALLALRAAGTPLPADAVAWLDGQQCDDGLWTAYRADTSVACPAVDPKTFAGPDTNSTALAVLGLQGSAAAAAGTTGLRAVRNPGGGWGYLAASDQPTDANSTGVVASALLTEDGAADEQALGALEALQLGCDAAAADRGGVAFMPQGSALFPDAMATTQAVPALAAVPLPVAAGDTTAGVPDVCAAPVVAPPTTAAPAAVAAVDQAAPTTDPGGTVTAARGLARTGSTDGPLALTGVLLVAGGVVLVRASDRRRRGAV